MTEQTGWIRAIDEALVVHHIGIADPTDNYETAKRKLNVLLCVAQQIGEDFGKQALNLPEQEPVACSNTFSCRCPKHFNSPTPRKPLTVPDGYALISIAVLKAWGKYDEVLAACQYGIK